MIYAQETMAQAQAEMEPLFAQHWEEIAWRKDKIALAPNYAAYAELERKSVLKIYTARKEGELIGYACWFVSPLLHYSTTLCATNDIVYVNPRYRGGTGMRLVRFSEAELKKLGVQVLGLHIKDCLNWGPLAERIGYERTEANWHKWIGD